MTKRFQRAARLLPRLVRITGHAGEPWWGVILTRKARDDTYSVCVLRRAHSEPARTTVSACYVRPACLLDASEALLDAFVQAGALAPCERRKLVNQRKALLRPCSKPLRREVTVLPSPKKPDRDARPWANIGAGKQSLAHVKMLGELRSAADSRGALK